LVVVVIGFGGLFFNSLFTKSWVSEESSRDEEEEDVMEESEVEEEEELPILITSVSFVSSSLIGTVTGDLEEANKGSLEEELPICICAG
jgi:hypothetical protein